MSYSKTIVCLANSRKTSGRCIAGKEVLDDGYGEWIRPISLRDTSEISEEERRYDNGDDSKILDIIEIQFIKHSPYGHQTENHKIDSNYYWVKKGEFLWADLSQIVENPPDLWGTGFSSYSGANDRIPIDQALGYDYSLTLIKLKSLDVRVDQEGAQFGNPKRYVRAQFYYNEQYYGIVVTDPIAERAFFSKPNGRYSVDDVYLCVSLGNEYDGYYYKFIAAIINRKGF